MTDPPRFGRCWRERKIESLERQLRELHVDHTRRWARHPIIPYEITRFEEYLRIHPGVFLHVGRTREEVLREPGWRAYIHPGDRGRLEQIWWRYCLEGRPVEGLELRYRHVKSDHYVYLEDCTFPVSRGRDGRPVRFSGWFENITDRKRAEIEFLQACLQECSRPTARQARREIVLRSLRESSDAGARRHLLGPRRLRRARPPR